MLHILAAASVAYHYRTAVGADALTIGTRIVREKMNPLFLSPERFVVATPSAESKEVLGFGQLRPAPGVAWELASLVVEPEHRGQGIGSGILRRLLSQHRASSASEGRVCLLTLRSTRGFYERLGFAVTSSPPLPMLLEYAIGTVVAKAAVDDSLVCMVWDGVVPEER